MKIRPVGSRDVSCGQIDRRTDMKKLIIAFCNLANVSNKGMGHEQ